MYIGDGRRRVGRNEEETGPPTAKLDRGAHGSCKYQIVVLIEFERLKMLMTA